MRERQRYVQQVETLLNIAERRLPPESPVIKAGRRRLDRMRYWEEQEAQRPCTAPRDLVESAEIKRLSFSHSKSSGMRALLDKRLLALELWHHSIPAERSLTVYSLATELQRGTSTGQERAWAAFCWVAGRIRCGGPEATERGQRGNKAALRTRTADARGFAELYQALCQTMGVEAEVVVGQARAIEEGFDASTPHAWNAVRYDSDWVLVDCYAAARCPRELRPYFYGTLPAQVVFTHLPEEDRWQLLEHPLSTQHFADQPLVRTHVFFELGLSFCPEYRPSGRVVLGTGEGGEAATVRLRAPPGVDVQAAFAGATGRCVVESVPEVKTASVRVKVLSARNLLALDPTGSSDPYCLVHLQSRRTLHHARTRTVQRTTNPSWNEVFDIHECRPESVLEFEVYDWDYVTQDDSLGTATLPLRDILQPPDGVPFEGELRLEGEGPLALAGSCIRVRVEPYDIPKPEEPASMVSVHLEVEEAHAGPHVLEIVARRPGPGDFQLACAFKVEPAPTPASPEGP